MIAPPVAHCAMIDSFESQSPKLLSFVARDDPRVRSKAFVRFSSNLSCVVYWIKVECAAD
jgi:hypothetical protein